MEVPPDPEPALFEMIGRLCSAWSSLEFETEQCIWGILKINKAVGQHVTWPMDMRGRWALLMSISKEINKPIDHDFIKDLNDAIPDLNRTRNTIVHGLLLILPATGVHSWVVFRGPDAGKPQPASATFVTETMQAIQRISDKLKQYNDRKGYRSSPFNF